MRALRVASGCRDSFTHRFIVEHKKVVQRISSTPMSRNNQQRRNLTSELRTARMGCLKKRTQKKLTHCSWRFLHAKRNARKGSRFGKTPAFVTTTKVMHEKEFTRSLAFLHSFEISRSHNATCSLLSHPPQKLLFTKDNNSRFLQPIETKIK